MGWINGIGYGWSTILQAWASVQDTDAVSQQSMPYLGLISEPFLLIAQRSDGSRSAVDRVSQRTNR